MNHKYFLFGLLLICTFQNLVAQSTGCISGNCVTGMGTYLFGNKSEYTGEWVNGARTGLGCYDWEDGSYYYGYFNNGVLEGEGIYIGNDSAKTTLIGRFHEGKLAESRSFSSSGCILGSCSEGIGVYLWSTDDIYVGEWHEGVRSGYGRFDWADGSFYTGYFKDNLLDGRGYYSSADGKTMDGYFEKNIFTRAATPDNNSSGSSSDVDTRSANAKRYDDVCSLVQDVIKSFPNNFNDVLGTKDKDATIIGSWSTAIRFSDDEEAGVISGFDDMSTPAMWYDKVNTFLVYQDAKNAYNTLVTKISNCPSACCSFKTSTDSKEDERYTTYLDPSYISSGYSKTYDDMQVIVELKKSGINWDLEIQIINVNKF